MKWFTGLNNHNKTLYDDYIKMYKVAVFTAKETNPSIKPYLILDGEIDDSVNELINMGVNVIQHRVSFSDKILAHYKDDTIALGAFLRIDIPKICETLKIEDEYILYTDNDVYFIGDVTPITNYKPEFFAACGEFIPTLESMNMNSGVMWINWKSMLNEYDDFVKYIVENFANNMYDQDALKKYYDGRITSLNPLFNYKPYWGPNNNIKILHFHGPKPTFDEKKLKEFPFQALVTPFYREMTIKFNKKLETI